MSKYMHIWTCKLSLQIPDLLSWSCETPSDWCCVDVETEIEALQSPYCSCTRGGRTFLLVERKENNLVDKQTLKNEIYSLINPESVSFTFGFRWTALAELEKNAVRAHSFLLVAAEKLLQAAEVSFGSTKVKLPAGRPGYLAVLVFYSSIHLQ